MSMHLMINKGCCPEYAGAVAQRWLQDLYIHPVVENEFYINTIFLIFSIFFWLKNKTRFSKQFLNLWTIYQQIKAKTVIFLIEIKLLTKKSAFFKNLINCKLKLLSSTFILF